ncbi:PoNe immunity protein domain-containing protein [Pseudomonas sp. DE0010]|uniref:PoNe immunity protein domain-containing protein n=1 Tax=Pseudomonas sp. DE0010 TaxID=2584951 RepID=UPI0011A68A9E|nr:PoNe immunity protein domain-containing protein [Pseudomonas sp. DE0010]
MTTASPLPSAALNTPALPNWEQWAVSKIPADQFEQRREPHLRYVTYTAQFDEILERIQLVCTRISTIAIGTKPGGMMNSTNLRLCDLLDWLSLQYSAGAPVELFAEIWPCAMEWAEEYAQCHTAYHDSPESGNHLTPHAALRTEDYWTMALRLTSFGLLTGNAAQMPRVMQFLDYGNEDKGVRDGLLERLVAPFVTGRGIPPDTATRHLPYRKLFKVFDAAPDKRPPLMAKYLGEWYHASRREPYIDQHGEADVSFYGYWAWEAAAVTWLLDIDDSSYRDMPFYPRDLLDFARNLPAPPATQQQNT